jgi:hypothetical protein
MPVVNRRLNGVEGSPPDAVVGDSLDFPLALASAIV